MDLGARARRARARDQEAQLILLDTHAVIWLHRGNRRTRKLEREGSLYLSPASMLELQFLADIGRVRLRAGATVRDLANDHRWLVDEAPSVAWFERACDVGWTRDPFDRLLVAHARLRGWRLATADESMLEHLEESSVLEL